MEQQKQFDDAVKGIVRVMETIKEIELDLDKGGVELASAYKSLEGAKSKLMKARPTQ